MLCVYMEKILLSAADALKDNSAGNSMCIDRKTSSSMKKPPENTQPYFSCIHAALLIVIIL